MKKLLLTLGAVASVAAPVAAVVACSNDADKDTRTQVVKDLQAMNVVSYNASSGLGMVGLNHSSSDWIGNTVKDNSVATTKITDEATFKTATGRSFAQAITELNRIKAAEMVNITKKQIGLTQSELSLLTPIYNAIGGADYTSTDTYATAINTATRALATLAPGVTAPSNHADIEVAVKYNDNNTFVVKSGLENGDVIKDIMHNDLPILVKIAKDLKVIEALKSGTTA